MLCKPKSVENCGQQSTHTPRTVLATMRNTLQYLMLWHLIRVVSHVTCHVRPNFGTFPHFRVDFGVA